MYLMAQSNCAHSTMAMTWHMRVPSIKLTGIIAHACFRLLTILNSSEEAGLQLLGPDDKAIITVRLISILTSILTVMVAHLIFNSLPPILPILISGQIISVLDLIRCDPGIVIYFVTPILSMIINFVTALVSNLI